MSTNNIDDLFVRHIKGLPRAHRIELLARVAQDLADTGGAQTEDGTRRSIMELHGLGKELWQGTDADNYINKLRDEWDDHSR